MSDMKSIQFKVSLEEWAAWKHASFDAGSSLGHMIRNVVNASLVKGRPVPVVGKGSGGVPAGVVEKVSARLVEPVVISSPAEAREVAERIEVRPFSKAEQARGKGK